MVNEKLLDYPACMQFLLNYKSLGLWSLESYSNHAPPSSMRYVAILDEGGGMQVIYRSLRQSFKCLERTNSVFGKSLLLTGPYNLYFSHSAR